MTFLRGVFVPRFNFSQFSSILCHSLTKFTPSFSIPSLALQPYPSPRPLQVLGGHDRAVTCVSLSLELDAAASGSEDGSVNVYAAREGLFLRSVRPFSYGDGFVVAQLALSSAGHLVSCGKEGGHVLRFCLFFPDDCEKPYHSEPFFC